MDPDSLKNLILNVKTPVVVSGLKIPWSCFNETLEEVLNKLHAKDSEPGFDIAPQTHGNSPQFERFRKIDKNINFGNFLTYSSSEKQKEYWATFSYKSLEDLPCASSLQPMNMEFCGFPEIDREITFWLGSRGAHTSCHYDTYGRNVVVQVHGRKRWIMFSPECQNLCPTRIPLEESSVYSSRTFFSPKMNDNADLAEHAYIVDLSPGDMLIVPPKWWHYVEALDSSMSFNAWIPIDEDRVSRVDEYLVSYQLSKIIPSDLSPKKRNLLFNPNPQHWLAIPFSDRFLEILVQDAKESENDIPKKQQRRMYETNYLTTTQFEDLIQQNIEKIRIISKDPHKFSLTMRVNSLRFCAKTEEEVNSTLINAQLTTLVALINSLCAPSTIETARKILLNSDNHRFH